MLSFVGRARELAFLDAELDRVRAGGDRPGRCLLIRGRRRVGKSRLVEEFLDRSGVPGLYFTAAGADPTAELRRFAADAAQSTLPGRDTLAAASPRDWDAALQVLAATLPADTPSVVVLDEVPYLMDDGRAFEGVLQRAWDRQLSRRPVLLVLIGSDLSMMEALNAYGRPFHQRGRELVIGPLTPADLADMLRLPAADALDAYLVTGGLPLVAADWTPGSDLTGFLDASLADPTSPLLVSAERSLAAEFPTAAQAGTVLAAIGAGERTFTNLTRGLGLASTSLQRSLDTLIDKRMVAAELPVALRPSRDRRFRVADPYLRFWLRFLGPYLAEVERGRGDLTAARIRTGWPSWRGRAVEPVIREALARLVPDGRLPAADAVGGYWTRTNDVEIDIVGADRAPVARELRFVGSIKWLENATFDARDLADLRRHAATLTAEPLPLAAVSRAGVSCAGLDAVYGPDDLVTAWRAGPYPGNGAEQLVGADRLVQQGRADRHRVARGEDRLGVPGHVDDP
jgi:AAA+ ATPase superfamily predicted ATPase